MGERVTVRKLAPDGRELWRWSGEVRARGDGWARIDAPFSGNDRDLGYLRLRQGDRFVEWYYADRWYNIFEIHDVDDDRLKGWYCNIARPAEFGEGEIAHADLALDLFVYPDGRILLQDEDEFEALALGDADRRAALDAVAQLRVEVEARRPPFDAIPRER